MPALGAVRVEGLKELDRKLKMLGPKVLRRVVRGGASKAMTPVNKDAKQRAKAIKDTGLLAKSIGRRMRTYTRSGVVTVTIGPRSDFKHEVVRRIVFPDGRVVMRKMWSNPSKYAHLVELGTQPHHLGGSTNLRKGIAGTGAMHPGTKPRPFLRPALDTNEFKVLAIYRRELAAGVVREAKKNA